MTFKEMVKNYYDCVEFRRDIWREKIYVHDIGVWKKEQWLATFITVNKSAEDFKNWVKEKGYEKKEFHFVGGYTEI